MLGSAGEGTAAVGETHDGPSDTAGNDTRQAVYSKDTAGNDTRQDA